MSAPAAKVREVGKGTPPVSPKFRLSDERSVIVRARLPGGLFELRYEGGAEGFELAQVEFLQKYIEMWTANAREEEKGPAVVASAGEHTLDPASLHVGTLCFHGTTTIDTVGTRCVNCGKRWTLGEGKGGT